MLKGKSNEFCTLSFAGSPVAETLVEGFPENFRTDCFFEIWTVASHGDNYRKKAAVKGRNPPSERARKSSSCGLSFNMQLYQSFYSRARNESMFKLKLKNERNDTPGM